jgi:hypothetical protein
MVLLKIAFAVARHPVLTNSPNDAMIGHLIIAFCCSKQIGNNIGNKVNLFRTKTR